MITDALTGASDKMYETMARVNGQWMEFTKMNFDTKAEALAWHEEAVQQVNKGEIAQIRSNNFDEEHFLWDLDELAGLLHAIA